MLCCAVLCLLTTQHRAAGVQQLSGETRGEQEHEHDQKPEPGPGDWAPCQTLEGRRKRPKLRDVEGAWASLRASPSSGTYLVYMLRQGSRYLSTCIAYSVRTSPSLHLSRILLAASRTIPHHTTPHHTTHQQTRTTKHTHSHSHSYSHSHGNPHSLTQLTARSLRLILAGRRRALTLAPLTAVTPTPQSTSIEPS
ncbi:uncharacterized protein LY79DRAFT_633316 [Colletotrichum navitas]|uniref:Uncharacterized protein n=1 Tax=Colletotrichum navitas TaxID=681940 RepID=A0AAD8V3Z8_9PEZI|nr:uncharacterized protein LY79DRAFT_633316 [Colletotrichum navitas]KAK1589862.1 hypothetical protein LY79DRAFT_633316 [Colletotrichum navitas]